MGHAVVECSNKEKITVKIKLPAHIDDFSVFCFSWLYMYDQDGVHQEWGEIEHGTLSGGKSCSLQITENVDTILSFFSHRETLPTSFGYLLRRDAQVEAADIIHIDLLQR